ncbi:MAG: glycosyl transferase [Burkholderiales bacterium]|jgi:4-amino-4-deoxy-L-arabinose transferase-like glycosyltransferase|nr:glycosyl transferase [Burkholderiales bacterium]
MKKLDTSIQYLIILAILANAVGLFFPSLRSTFTPYYGSIAKHIVTSGNWSDLMLLNQDWLDKPHLPFWLTAISFKIFGINSFAYIFPGFLFHLTGLYFTYKIARFWYTKEVGLLAVLFTASALHLMLSSIDVRAEAFMLGEIVPACYFWLCYDKNGGVKYLLGGALFTAFGLMTKGPFVLITIISGIAALWIYRGRWRNFISFKWIFALILSCVFILPELWALYLQFDLHPKKVIYGQTHVSGIKWFFWDSQFGRFLSTGPIKNNHADFSHYFFFLHTLLWAYLPWWPLFIVATWQFIKDFIQRKSQIDAQIFLFASFFVTFILFSVSVFQVDHYTNILFPFASIICAAWLNKVFTNCKVNYPHPLFYVECVIATILFLAILILAPLTLSGLAEKIILGLDILVWITIIYLRNKIWHFKIIALPTLAISLVFVFLMTVNGTMYSKYDGGYQIANYLNAQKNISVVSYNIDSANQMDMLGLNFHSKNSYQEIKDLNRLEPKQNYLIYLVIEEKDLAMVKEKLPGVVVEKIFKACAIETFIAHILQPGSLNKNLYTYVLLKV